MNIFYLDQSPIISAEMMTNKHVVKMILESAQLLSTAHRVLDGDVGNELLYKKTHVNHPSAIWTRESLSNYYWLYNHFVALNREYTLRYHKVHKTYTLLNARLMNAPKHIQSKGLTPVRCAITNKNHVVEGNPVQSYRNYYESEKLMLDLDKQRYYNILTLHKGGQ